MQNRWIAFDLDDTLHDFRRASRAAMEGVYDELASVAGPVDRDDLRRLHGELVKRDAPFTAGLTSVQYRGRRFESLARSAMGTVPNELLGRLLDLYQISLESNLRLCAGAETFLEYLFDGGWSVAVITEGPEDAQKWTIERLGISKYVKLLVTSSKYRKSKVDGLFDLAFRKLKNRNDERIVYFGDSFERDIVPAGRAGFDPVLVCGGASANELKVCRLQGYRIAKDLVDAMDHFR